MKAKVATPTSPEMIRKRMFFMTCTEKSSSNDGDRILFAKNPGKIPCPLRLYSEQHSIFVVPACRNGKLKP